MTVVTVETKKSSPDELAGVGFTRKDEHSPLIIAEIHQNGLFSKSPIVKGLVVKKINGKSMLWSHPRAAAEEIKNSPDKVSITVEGFVARVIKPRKAMTGIVLKDQNNEVVISKIRRNSLFSSTDLRAGMKILSINKATCPRSASAAINMIQRTDGKLKIVATGGYKDGMTLYRSEILAVEKSPPSEDLDDDSQASSKTEERNGEEHKGGDKNGDDQRDTNEVAYQAYRNGQIFQKKTTNTSEIANNADNILVATVNDGKNDDEVNWIQYQRTFLDKLCCRFSSFNPPEQEKKAEEEKKKSLLHASKKKAGWSKKKIVPADSCDGSKKSVRFSKMLQYQRNSRPIGKVQNTTQ